MKKICGNCKHYRKSVRYEKGYCFVTTTSKGIMLTRTEEESCKYLYKPKEKK
jgi:hypothetical protein